MAALVSDWRLGLVKSIDGRRLHCTVALRPPDYRDPLSQLPDELVFLVLSFVPLCDYEAVARVSKRLRELALDQRIWAVRFDALMASMYPSAPLQRRKRSLQSISFHVKMRGYEYVRTLRLNVTNIDSIPPRQPLGYSSFRHPKQAALMNIWEEPEEGRLFWGERLPSRSKVVTAGSLNQLVALLTSVDYKHIQFMKAFLMTFESFTTVEALFTKLMQRYFVPAATSAQFPTREAWRKQLVMPVKFHVINVLKMLIAKYVERVCENEWIMERIALFIWIILPHDGFGSLAADLQQLLQSKILAFEQRQEQVEVLEDISADLAKIDWRVFTDRQIAENLTLLDHLAHRSLTPSELLNKSWARPEKHRIAPTLVKMLRRFNTVTRWVMQQILEPTTLHGRAHVLERFISIGQHLLKLNNFQSMTSVLAALNSYAVMRLKETWGRISADSQAAFAGMDELMNPYYNYKNYRLAIYSAEPPCVPFISAYLMDLDFLQTRGDDEELIAFSRHQKTYEVISNALMFQNPRYHGIEKHARLCGYLHHLSLVVGDLSEDDLSQRSQEREPTHPH